MLVLYLLGQALPAQAQSPGGVSAGLGAWWKADYSASALAWSDASGKGHHATKVGGTITYNASGGAATNFNPQLTSAGGYMSYSSPVYTSTATYDSMDVFTVMQPLSAEHCIPWGEDGNNGGYQTSVYHYGGDNNLHFQAPYSYDAYAAFTGSYGVSNLAEGRKSFSSMWLYQQGKQIAGYTTGGAALYSTGTYNYLLAQPYRTTTGGSGVSEVIVYNKSLSAAERLRINAYLAIKYGITLDQTAATNYVNSSGTTIWDATVNAAWNKNIAGIGRDDGSGLSQKQSRSVNSGSQVVISLGTVAAAGNSANSSSFSANQQFLVWGDDGGSLSTMAATGGSAYLLRFSRVWKAQHTGSLAQASTVYFPVSAFGSVPAASVALLYGTSLAALSNGTAGAIAQSGTTAINGTSYYVFSVPAAQVANLQYFSFTTSAASPGGVSGATSWFKADAGVTLNGSNVSAWANQVANPVLTQLTQATSSLQPAYSSSGWNFNPNITYNADMLDTTMTSVFDVLSATSNDVFGVVSKSSSSAVYLQISDDGRTSNRFSCEGSTFHFPSTYSVLSTGFTATEPSIFNAATTTSGSQSSFVLNGGTAATLTYVGSLSAGSIPRYVIGACKFNSGATIGYYLYGSFPEVVTYNVSLTPTQKKQVQSYLAVKYGQTLAHDYIASDGTTTTYTISGYANNIAGIGRDDQTALNQKQSQSVNTGSQVVMSLGTVAATNAANTGSFAANQQFLIWGDDGGSLSTMASTGANIYQLRFSRVWRAQNTGSFAQGCTLYFPVSAFGSASASSVALLYGSSAAALSNGTAGTIAQSGTTTVSGSSYYIFSVPAAQLANLQYFSFTTSAVCPGGVSAGLKIWHKAEAGVTAASNLVTGWTNQVDGRQVINSGGSYRPTLNTAATFFNFNPCIDFSATSNSLYDAGAAPFGTDGDMTWFLSSRVVSGTQIFGVNKTPSYTTDPYDDFDWYTSDVRRSGTAIATYSSTLANSTQSIITCTQDGAADKINMYANLSPIVNDVTNTYALGSGGYVFGSDLIAGGNDLGFVGSMSEFAAYNRVLTAAERQRVQSYLAIKTGVSLNQNYVLSDGTTVVWNSAAAGSYRSNIAGIGRDDASGLTQKQSQSVSSNANGQVAIGIGSIAATNSANTGSFPTDKNFLTWSDNGNTQSLAAATAALSYNGTSSNLRMTRVWQVQNTGVSQAVQIRFPVTSVGTSAALPAACSDYVIVWAADSAFTSGVTVSPLSTGGGNYVVSHTFPQGTSYFSYAQVLKQAPGTAYLPYSSAAASTATSCTYAPNWKYYYYDAGQTQKAFAINWNGNTEPGGINGVLTYSASPYSNTGGGYQCNIMGRLLEILPAGGSYTANGGVQVKIFFDSTELNASLVSSVLSRRWFKYSGNATATLAANNGQNIAGAAWLTPAASGEEDGIDYVQFNGITSFSTFGFASNSGPVALPVTLLSFTGRLQDDKQVQLSWTVGSEKQLDAYEAETSRDGASFTAAAVIPAAGQHSYSATVSSYPSRTYCRLRLRDKDGSSSYSQVLSFAGSAAASGNAQLRLFPNPVSGAQLSLALSGFGQETGISITDLAGKNVWPELKVPGDGQYTLDIGDLPAGMYCVQARSGHPALSIAQKLVITR